MSPRILVELTHELCGPIVAEEMAQTVGQRNQPKELSMILLSYISVLKGAGSAIPTLADYRLLLEEARQIVRETIPHPKPPGPPKLPGKSGR